MPAPTPARQAPRVVTVLAGVGLVVLLLGLLAVVSPTVRSQLALSTSRQDAAYVETYFTQVEQARACNSERPRYVAEVGVLSHLDRAETVPYVVTLDPLRGDGSRTAKGEVETTPGEESVVKVAVRKPSRRYTVTITFPGRDQRLVVHCAGGRR